MKRYLTGLVCAVSLLAGATHAQDVYPSRPIRLIVPQTAGTDHSARMMAEHLSNSLGQPVVVQNLVGANGIPAAVALTKEKPDGYTLMFGIVSQMTFNQLVYKNVPYDGFRDFTWIAPVTDLPWVLVASKASGIKTVNDLFARAKAEPGKLNYASSGNGNVTHLSVAMLASRAGLKMQHVPYKGAAPAITSVISGESDLLVMVVGAVLPQIQAGNIVPLAVLGPSRIKALPNLPTFAESGSGIVLPKVPGWTALVGPAGMPDAVREKLAQAVNGFVNEAAVKTKMVEMNIEGINASGAEFQRNARSETDIWARFISENQIVAD
jgi:tripartite-type tricarboxylate transporter receptor subunit TctC